MSRPVIVVDIDEVLARHTFALAQWHNEQFGTSHTEHEYVTERWAHIWGTDERETERRAALYQTHDIYTNLPVVDGAKEALGQLARIHDLVVVTVRRKSVMDATYIWLDKHFSGIFQDVRFIHYWDDQQIKTTKSEIATELHTSYLIDDGLRHCTLAAESGIEAFLFGDYAWNKTDALPAGVTRVRGWHDITEYFHER